MTASPSPYAQSAPLAGWLLGLLLLAGLVVAAGQHTLESRGRAERATDVERQLTRRLTCDDCAPAAPRTALVLR